MIGPTLPGAVAESTDDASKVSASAPRRVLGPAMPPPASTRDEGVGSSSALQTFLEREERMKRAAKAGPSQDAGPSSASQRDDWMLSMPSAQSYTEALRGDTSLALKNRGFSQAASKRVQSRASAANAPTDDGSLWMETPAQREKRLLDEETGIRAKSSSQQQTISAEEQEEEMRKRKREEEIARAVQEHNAKRGPSLLEQHQAKRRGDYKTKDSSRHRSRRSRSSDYSRAESDDSEDERRRRRRRKEREAADDRDAGRGDRRRRERDERSSSHSSRRTHDKADTTRRSVSPRRTDRRKRASDSDSDSNDKRRRSHRSPSRERRHREKKEARRREKEAERRDRDRDKNRHRHDSESSRQREKPQTGSAPMMVWDRDAAMSVGGRLMGEKQRTDTIRSAAGLADRFSGGGGGGGGSRFL